MAKKPAPKNQPAAPPPPGRSYTALLALAAVIIVAVAAVAYMRVGRSEPEQQEQAAAPAAPLAPLPGPPANAKYGPHKQAVLPGLPFSGFPPPRPIEVVGAAYRFAAEHPEVLGYMPCYCGCERSGHRGNDDCFVARRDENGDVTEWEPHGMT